MAHLQHETPNFRLHKFALHLIDVPPGQPLSHFTGKLGPAHSTDMAHLGLRVNPRLTRRLIKTGTPDAKNQVDCNF